MRTDHTYAGMKLLVGRDWEIVMYYDGKKNSVHTRRTCCLAIKKAALNTDSIYNATF